MVDDKDFEEAIQSAEAFSKSLNGNKSIIVKMQKETISVL
jgi:hypothetical protein